MNEEAVEIGTHEVIDCRARRRFDAHLAHLGQIDRLELGR
jgi:hypothetical protein